MRFIEKKVQQTEYIISLTEDELQAIRIVLGSLGTGEFETRCSCSLAPDAMEVYKRNTTIDKDLHSDIVSILRGYDNYGKSFKGRYPI